MLNLNLFRNIGFPLYLFVYLILPYSAITQTLKVDFIRNLETSLNKRDLEFIRKNFRNDDNKIDISFKIPEKVLTGSKYDIDIILNKPLEEVIITGAIKAHQVNSLFEQEILLEPLASGGIFKMTRAPSKPGIQIWSGIIAHPEGCLLYTSDAADD